MYTMEDLFSEWLPESWMKTVESTANTVSEQLEGTEEDLSEGGVPSVIGLLWPTGVRSIGREKSAGPLSWAAAAGHRKLDGDVQMAHLPDTFQGASKYRELGIGNPSDELLFNPIEFPKGKPQSQTQPHTSTPTIPKLNAVLQVENAPLGCDSAKVPLHYCRETTNSSLRRVQQTEQASALQYGVDHLTNSDPSRPITGGVGPTGFMLATEAAISVCENQANMVAPVAMLPGKKNHHTEDARPVYNYTSIQMGKKGRSLVEQSPKETYGPEKYSSIDTPKVAHNFRFLKPLRDTETGEVHWEMPSRDTLAERYIRNVIQKPD